MKKLSNIQETQQFADKLAKILRPGDIILFKGDLGSGKSTFIRHMIHTLLDHSVTVPSPTFTLVQTYETPGFLIWHFDLYRLEQPEEAHELDIDEAFQDGVSLIEWPERLGYLVPNEHLLIEINHGTSDDERLLTLKPTTSWVERLQNLA